MIKVTSLTNYYNGHVLDNSEFESLDSWIDECVLNRGRIVETPDLSECSRDLGQKFLDTIKNRQGLLYEWSVDDIDRSYYFIESIGRDYDDLVLSCVKSLLLQRNS